MQAETVPVQKKSVYYSYQRALFSVSCYNQDWVTRKTASVYSQEVLHYRDIEVSALANTGQSTSLPYNTMAQDERGQLDQRIDHVTNESVDSTRRMRAMAEETRHTGVDTMITLNEQGEQLDNMERRLDEINVDLNRTDDNLTTLEKCCSCFTCVCCAPKNMKKTRQYKRAYGYKAQQGDLAVTSQPRSSGGHSRQAQGPFIKRITDDDRETQIEENLQYVVAWMMSYWI